MSPFSLVARKRQLRVVPDRRPVRPIRCRKLAARDLARGIDLNDAVEVADVDSEFQHTGRHDHAVLPVGEGVFGLPSLVDRE